MTMKHETIEVTLGVFNKPNRNGVIFEIDRNKLITQMEGMVGKIVGEIGQPAVDGPVNFNDILRRMCAVQDVNSAGVLQAYSIVDNPDGSYQVNGKVKLSSKLDWLLDNSDPEPVFGIRALTEPSKAGEPIKEIINLISFDYIPPHKR